jgi:hypothetical protein
LLAAASVIGLTLITLAQVKLDRMAAVALAKAQVVPDKTVRLPLHLNVPLRADAFVLAHRRADSDTNNFNESR